MTVEKVIQTVQSVDIEITGITLLSAEEYDKYKMLIPLYDAGWWWLRSSYSNYGDCAWDVGDIGGVNHGNVEISLGVRPTLICNFKSSNLKPGDTIRLAGYTWTVISDRYIQCNDIVGKSAFRKDWKSSDANDYEKSDIKKWLENWAEEKELKYWQRVRN